MTYSRQSWVDNSVAHPASADRFSHMEDGIEEASLKLSPVSFGQAGTLTVTSGQVPFTLPEDADIVSVVASVGTAPTGSSILVDVNVNGASIFTTQANRPEIVASATSSAIKTPDVTSAVAGAKITVDVDQVGSTVAGADLGVIVGLRY